MTQKDGMIQQMLKLHNEVRKKHDRPPLSLHPQLREAAQQHADYMQKQHKLTHEGQGDSDPGERIKKAGYQWADWRENIAWGGGENGTPDKIFHGSADSWMGSEDHKKNLLLKHMQHVGFGSTPGDEGEYWCAVYAERQG